MAFVEEEVIGVNRQCLWMESDWVNPFGQEEIWKQIQKISDLTEFRDEPENFSLKEFFLAPAWSFEPDDLQEIQTSFLKKRKACYDRRS